MPLGFTFSFPCKQTSLDAVSLFFSRPQTSGSADRLLASVGQLLKPPPDSLSPLDSGQFSCHRGLTQLLRHTLQNIFRPFSTLLLLFKACTSSGKPSGPPGKKNLALLSVPCFFSCCLVVALFTQFLVLFCVFLFFNVIRFLSQGSVFPTGPSPVC